MPFFKPHDPDSDQQYERPPSRPWERPHPGELGGFVPLRVELARTNDHIVLLGPMEAHPNGVVLELEVRGRRPDLDPIGWHGGGPAGELRFGVEFSDGRNTEDAGRFWEQMDEPGDGPILLPGGGGGGGGVYRHHYWLWPLPLAGDLRFHVVWADAGIAETTTVIDASAIRDAATSAETLWDPLTPEEEHEAMRMMHRRLGASSGHTFSAVVLGSDSEADVGSTEQGNRTSHGE